jgi:hypothetical protein
MMNVALRQEEVYACAFLSLTMASLRNPWVLGTTFFCFYINIARQKTSGMGSLEGLSLLSTATTHQGLLHLPNLLP